MCGIAGRAGPGIPPPEAIAAGVAALAHRGPDDADTLVSGGDRSWWALGHTRLSIVDLSPAGRQPMSCEDGSLSMVYNGEIYNFAELRRYCEAKGHRFQSSMDGEVILHLWEMEGVACLARLNGIFAVAVANSRSGEVWLARDPVGVKPLFYAVGPPGELYFASELGALRALGAPLGDLDPVALAQFLAFLWIPQPRTPHEEAKSVLPGEALRWSPEGWGLQRYADALTPVTDPRPMGDDVVGELGERLDEAVQRQLLSDVPIGLMASGGVDSGLLWGSARPSLARAFTIEWGGDDTEGLHEDTEVVRELADRWGTSTAYLPGRVGQEGLLPPSGDLFADPAYGLTGQIAARANEEGLKVLLSGQGGDELFAGYRRHTVAPIVGALRLGPLGRAVERPLHWLPTRRLGVEYAARLARAAAEPDAFAGYMQLCTYSSAEDRAAVLGCSATEVADEVVWARHREVFDALPRELSFLRRAMAVDLNVYLPGLGLAYVDRAGMQFGVEIRVPWLDLDLLRWTLTLPDDGLLRRRRGKWLPRALAAQRLGAAIAHRPKRPFGAPADRFGGEGQGSRGFRQNAYLARAADVLDSFLGRTAHATG